MPAGIRSVRVRTMMAAVAAAALAMSAVNEGAIWYETQKFLTFHRGRAQQFLEKAEPFRASRPEVWGTFREFAAWHAERETLFRRAHTTWFHEEGSEDVRQTIREQDYEATVR